MRTANKTEGWAGSVFRVLFPKLCAGCGKPSLKGISCFCVQCQNQLIPANMAFSRENEFTDRFWGRVPIESGAALYFFQRRSPLQRALHRLKYHRQGDIGLQLGRMLGGHLKLSPLFLSVAAAIPVPLHPKKQQLRGYNQSALIARGLAEAMSIPILDGVLMRQVFSESQTRKRRMERFDNVEEVFTLMQPEQIEGKHVLLVDDVLTTGATLEACAKALLKTPSVRLSMATLAITSAQMH